MTKWEYKRVRFFGDTVPLDELNSLGQEGWEAVWFQQGYTFTTGNITDTTESIVLFKRQLQEEGKSVT